MRKFGKNRHFNLATKICGRVAFVIACLSMAAGAHAQLCLPPTNGLVGWWPGDGSARDIIGTNNGVLMGGATANTPGFVGQAFHFDGTNGFVQVPNAPELNPAQLTVECWVRFDSLDAPGNTANIGTQYMVFKKNTRNNTFEGYNMGKHRYAYDLFVWEVSSAGGTFIQLNSITAISTNVWYQVVATRGSNFAELYINGLRENSTNVTFPQDYDIRPLFFGSSGESSFDRKLAGSIDEVSLYNRVLTSNEIAALYAAGSAGKCKAPTVFAQPQPQNKYWSGSATLAPVVAGASPMSYKWLKDNLPLAGATNSSLVLSNLQMTNAGSYALQVTNTVGVTSTVPAVLSMKVSDVSIGVKTNAASLTIGGLVGPTYGIQFATNLTGVSNWFGLTNLILSTPTQIWAVPQPLLPKSYFRVVPGPIQLN
jgi:hypothetical protein